MPIVTPAGFAPEDAPDWTDSAESGDGLALRIETGADIDALAPHLERIALIGVAFQGFADGRVFGLGARLRRLGYRGRLRAIGPMIVDQAAHALACGFDEIQIDDAMAARQPERLWLRAFAARAPSPAEMRGLRRAA